VESDEAAKSVTILAGAHAALDLEAYRAMETELAVRHRDWKVQLVPPLIPLPEIRFESGSHALSPSAVEALETAAWALSRWELKNVEVDGYASSDRSGTRSLAARRAEEVARWLDARGFAARAVARYPAENQAARERALGREAFRKAVIVPGAGGGAGRGA
jgi:outer membrane protein OmpA-like peptidoglycan-associated protein